MSVISKFCSQKKETEISLVPLVYAMKEMDWWLCLSRSNTCILSILVQVTAVHVCFPQVISFYPAFRLSQLSVIFFCQFVLLSICLTIIAASLALLTKTEPYIDQRKNPHTQ